MSTFSSLQIRQSSFLRPSKAYPSYLEWNPSLYLQGSVRNQPWESDLLCLFPVLKPSRSTPCSCHILEHSKLTELQGLCSKFSQTGILFIRVMPLRPLREYLSEKGLPWPTSHPSLFIYPTLFFFVAWASLRVSVYFLSLLLGCKFLLSRMV